MCVLIWYQLYNTEASQNGNSVHGPQDGGSRAPLAVVDPSLPLVPISAAPPRGVPVPTTNLNIGMDYWAAPASSAVPALHGKVLSTPVTGGIVTAGSRDNQSQLWLLGCQCLPFSCLFLVWYFLCDLKNEQFLHGQWQNIYTSACPNLWCLLVRSHSFSLWQFLSLEASLLLYLWLKLGNVV